MLLFVWLLASATAASGASAVDYPPEALRLRLEGEVGFSVDVDADGRPTACRITRSSGHPVLDDATCSLMLQRGRFNPAYDAAGIAIASHYESRIDWRLPREAAPN